MSLVTCKKDHEEKKEKGGEGSSLGNHELGIFSFSKKCDIGLNITSYPSRDVFEACYYL